MGFRKTKVINKSLQLAFVFMRCCSALIKYKMTSNESKQIADLIWCKINSKITVKTKKDELDLIESVIIRVAQEQRKVGRNQILNHIECEVKSLRD